MTGQAELNLEAENNSIEPGSLSSYLLIFLSSPFLSSLPYAYRALRSPRTLVVMAGMPGPGPRTVRGGLAEEWH
jgi:hypothetical protein